ncbi:MAG: hypothetical protein AAFU85_15770 [Planctomycetota bacterium]
MFQRHLDELESLLESEIPLWCEGHSITETICCLRIYYYDTHAPYGYLTIKAVDANERELLHDEADDFFDAFWNPANDFGSGPEIVIGQEEASQWRVEQLLAEVYKRLGDDRHMQSYRAAIGRVCRSLNKFKWSKMFPVTDDFSVVMADGSCFLDDVDQDLVDSLPPKKYDQLVEIGWIDHAAPNDGGSSELSAIEAQSVPQRIRSCIDLLRTAADDASTDVGESDLLDLMIGCGKSGVEALLEFALEYADKPDWDSGGDELPHSGLILDVIWKVTDSGIASPKIELLLKQYVARSHQANLNERYATTSTRHAADCLRALFAGYPATEVCDETNRLLNASEFA